MGIVTVVEWIIFFFSFSLGRCKGEEGRKYLGKVSFFPFFFFFISLFTLANFWIHRKIVKIAQ